MTALGVVAALLLGAAALHELLGSHGELLAASLAAAAGARARSPAGRALTAAAGPRVSSGGSGRRASRAGSRPGELALARAASALLAIPAAVSLAPAAPGRTGMLVALGLPLAAALAPDLVLEQLIKRRRRAIGRGAAGVAGADGRPRRERGGPPSLLGDARAALGEGPLRREIAGAWAEVRCGVPQSESLARLGADAGPELAAMAVMIERSRRFGAPLADGLQAQAAALREEQGRRLAESAARAAPKIQLVVALMLVPSVLLLVGAAIAANADALLSGLGMEATPR